MNCRRALLSPLLSVPFCLAACGNRTDQISDAGTRVEEDATVASPEWHLVAEDLPGALFSVSGTAADDVWAVGADRGQGRGPTLVHYDGDVWSYLDSGLVDGDLLWVHALSSEEILSSGSRGTVVRISQGKVEVVRLPSEQDVNVWGVWASSVEDAWAVGGDPELGGATVWRDQGRGWEAVELNLEEGPKAWYKVWGTAADDVWLCGTGGTILHWDGSLFEQVETGTTEPLLTIAGTADGSEVSAVGGLVSSTVVSLNGSRFEVQPVEAGLRQLFGISYRGKEAYAVGMDAVIVHKSPDGDWVWPEDYPPTFSSLHGVWLDPEGGLWAAGGQIIIPPYGGGTLIYKGTRRPSALD